MATNQEIMDRFDSFEKTFAPIIKENQRVARTNAETLVKHALRLSEFDADLRGNGEPGIKERIRKMEAASAEQRFWSRALILAIAGDLVARWMGLI